jgi:hypothetical protein
MPNIRLEMNEPHERLPFKASGIEKKIADNKNNTPRKNANVLYILSRI